MTATQPAPVVATQERLPRVGWTRLVDPRLPGPLPLSISAWTDGQATVISALEMTEAPDGSHDIIATWHISVSERGKRPRPRVLRRALAAFGMLGVEQDNHHPGHACHFFQPVDPARRRGCECKVTEVVVTEPDGYQWTNPSDGPCRGCELAKLLPGQPCSLHPVGESAEPEALPAPGITVEADLLGFALTCACGTAWGEPTEAKMSKCPGCGDGVNLAELPEGDGGPP